MEYHGQPRALLAGNAGDRAFLRLFDRSLCPEDLLLLARADALGRRGAGDTREALAVRFAPAERTLGEKLALYRARTALPGISGRDLTEAGAAPGPLLGEALDYARGLRLAGASREEQLRQALGRYRALERERMHTEQGEEAR